MPSPRVIDKDAAHQVRGNGEEVRAVLPTHILLIHETEIRLVNQVRRLKGVARALTAHVAGSLAAQFPIDHGNQAV
jgi:hypothetical protein